MLYSCNVGHEFSFGFFQKSLNCCYDKDKGVLYTDDIKNFEKLDLNYHEEESNSGFDYHCRFVNCRWGDFNDER